MIEFFNSQILPIIMIILPIIGKVLLIILPLLGAVAYLTLMERKVIASMQLRSGPAVTGPFGLLQPIADGLKLMLKEVILPNKSNKVLFLVAPIITFVLALIGWAVIPFSETFVVANLNVGVTYLLASSSLGVYGIIISGWASNSKYAFLGAIRDRVRENSREETGCPIVAPCGIVRPRKIPSETRKSMGSILLLLCRGLASQSIEPRWRQTSQKLTICRCAGW